MSIEVPAMQLYALATTLRSLADEAGGLETRLAHGASVGRPLAAAVDGLLECHRTAARALAGELDWLGDTVSDVADSWLDLDAAVLARPGRAAPR